MSWADIYYAAITDFLTTVTGHDVHKDRPTLKKINENIRSNPNIKAYLEKRPKTIF